ncbi:hypothetical protein CQ14_06975 [Bradyrhizobium lablabi]|uniref:DUF559 domain-containing protein n=1 Tax=Bradyrhizobium lablabi TaxID=722472 RepID=A0A0R3MND4_9BRAD|nr:hypothetical protein [Bradyrhizobium lablabi]KRR21386.1 hypothetical protein CQ14_06975 [Bradyrhizobium lablabi]
MSILHVPDYLILPYGRAVKSDLQRIALSAVSADGLYFSTDVPVIFINKAKRRPICLGDFDMHVREWPNTAKYDDNDQTMLGHMCSVLKSLNPNMTTSEEQFLDLYFATLKALSSYASDEDGSFHVTRDLEIPFDWLHPRPKKNDIWRALLPIPELQLYVQDPLAETKSYQPDNNFRVDYGFWNGEQLIAVEIDGAEPAGYARDIRRDRLLRRAGVDVIHILNLEIAKHGARALIELLPRNFFGFDWSYEGFPPDILPF